MARPTLAAFLRRGMLSGAMCVGIALLLAARPGSNLAESLVYSLLIGGLCWLSIDGGRLLVASRLVQRDAGGPAAREGWPGWGWMSALIVVGVGIGFTLGTLAAEAILGEPSASGGLRGTLFVGLLSIIAAIVATGFFHARGRLAAVQMQAEAARRAAVETQLKLLQSQLEPHMLFNTLANLRALIATEPARAQAMLDRLISFLRATLSASRSGEMHALAAEFERLDDYLALMAVRMGARLAVRLDLPEELRALAVPPLLLQPLVENAIRHGLEPKVDGGRIDVSARRVGGRLRLAVRDSGVGLRAGMARTDTPFGLQQVRERLAATFGGTARLTVEPADGGGTVATIEWPLPEHEEPR
jgi:two-component sensor histidine kinase